MPRAFSYLPKLLSKLRGHQFTGVGITFCLQ
jgi:hypothetical protein